MLHESDGAYRYEIDTLCLHGAVRVVHTILELREGAKSTVNLCLGTVPNWLRAKDEERDDLTCVDYFTNYTVVSTAIGL